MAKLFKHPPSPISFPKGQGLAFPDCSLEKYFVNYLFAAHQSSLNPLCQSALPPSVPSHRLVSKCNFDFFFLVKMVVSHPPEHLFKPIFGFSHFCIFFALPKKSLDFCGGNPPHKNTYTYSHTNFLIVRGQRPITKKCAQNCVTKIG